MKIQPTGRYILIELVTPDTGKLITPDKYLNGRASSIGMRINRVVAVGEGLMASDGTIVPLSIEIGDEVILMPDTQMISPSRVFFNCGDVHLVDSKCVAAIVKERDKYMPREIVRGELVA